MTREKDYVLGRLLNAMEHAKEEEYKKAEKADPVLQSYDRIMDEVAKESNALAQRQCDETNALKAKLAPKVEAAALLLGAKKDNWNVRETYCLKQFRSIKDKYNAILNEIEGGVYLMGNKDLAKFMTDWLRKLGSK